MWDAYGGCDSADTASQICTEIAHPYWVQMVLI